MGLFGMRIPEEYGGLGLDLTTYALAIAELSRGWMSVAGIVNGVYIVSGMLAGHGTQEQKERYLPKIAAGEHALLLHDDRARGGLRRARDPHDRAPRGRRARHQRPEDVGHERHARQPHGPAREDRSEGRPAAGGHDRADRREGARARASRAASRSRKTGLPKLGYKGVESTEVAFDGPPRARLDDPRRARGRGPGLLPDDERHRDRAASTSAPAASASRCAPTSSRSATPRSAAPSASRSRSTS